MSEKTPIKILLGGDVMTGRGIDQILLHPVEPQIYEPLIKDAREYVLLAEYLNGKIPRRTHGGYIWGDALKELELRQPHLKLINLETSITKNGTPWVNKEIQYRMHPNNIDAITTAGINVCSLANNHMLDWGVKGLYESIETLNKANIHHAGAGLTLQQAQAPAMMSIPGMSARILIFSIGTRSSGIPSEWRATPSNPGVWLLDELNDEAIMQIKEKVDFYRQPEDICIISIHWGSNWVYQIPTQHQIFARELIDKVEVNLIHGHSSHHPIGIELYKNIPILYGCGDLMNDYEGINEHQDLRSDLSFMYFLDFDAQSLKLKQLEMVPFQRKNFQLHYASIKDCHWLLNALQKQSGLFNTQFTLEKNVIHCVV